MDDLELGILGLLAPNFAARLWEARQRASARTFQALLRAGPVTWDDQKTRFTRELLLAADSWRPTLLFDTPPVGGTKAKINAAVKGGQVLRCPGAGTWGYRNQIIPRGEALDLYQGARRGTVYFDADVQVPMLCTIDARFELETWMSVTPMEIMTQRQGVRRATGRCVVAGLGLGWLLNAVCSKKSVTEVVVVEKSRPLLTWLKPVLLAKYPALAKVSAWVCADIFKWLPTDAGNYNTTRYLFDIWKDYGGCCGRYYDWQKRLPHCWGWGDVEY